MEGKYQTSIKKSKNVEFNAFLVQYDISYICNTVRSHDKIILFEFHVNKIVYGYRIDVYFKKFKYFGKFLSKCQ